MKHSRGPRRGFTLIELLVVIAIIAILASILFPMFTAAKAKAREMRCVSNLKQMGVAVEMYCDDYRDVMPYPGGEDLERRFGKGYMLPAWDEDVYGGLDIYLKSKSAGDTIWRCPGGKRPLTTVPFGGTSNSLGRSYSFNDYLRPFNRGRNFWPFNGLNRAALQNPAHTIMIFESYQDNTPEVYAYRNGSPVFEGPQGLPMCMHRGKMNVLFCDGHVQSVFPPDTWTWRRWGYYIPKPLSHVFVRVRGAYNGPLPDMWAPFWPYDNYALATPE